ncbi:hypothetical protein IPA_09555 [Ignicoccus pacificus DSM 13166]|uniref:AAA+ ATPase domain-containing protein n=1 Tax=Ignicoccus pacificus DSM 13166 TaxID=940294 RepID=A0A977KC26_9CREN|nr:hypothetical protein IPA_09555 [Ignicoccus pacificus DSM 13166]
MVEVMIFEILVPTLVALIVCKRSNRIKRKRMFNVEDGIIKVVYGKKVIFVGGIEVVDIDPSRLYDEYYETIRQYSYALQRAAPGMILEIRLVKKPIAVNDILAKLEREITSLRVLKMSDPTDVKVDRKLRVLEKLYKVLSEGVPPASINLKYLLYSNELNKLRSEMQFISVVLENLLGAKVRKINNRELKRLINVNIIKSKDITCTAESLGLVYPHVKKSDINGIYIGKDISTNEPVFLGYDDLTHHVGVVGSTGSGKTTFLASLIYRLKTLSEDVDVTVVDPKGDLRYILEKVDLEVNVITYHGDPRLRNEKINDIMLNILNEIIEMNPTKRLRRLVVIDEAWIVSEELMEELVREGRSKGVGVVLSTQELGDLSDAILTNTHTMILFRSNSIKNEDLYFKLLGEQYRLLKALPRGEVFLRHQGHVKRILVDVEEILQVLTSTTLKSSIPNSSSTSLALLKEDGGNSE